MHQILRFFGGLLFLIGGIIAIGGFGAADRSGVAVVTIFALAAGFIVPGAMIFCFGEIVKELRKIRIASERQMQIFEAMEQRQERKVVPQRREPDLARVGPIFKDA
jgi:hypothetical protein